jgi:mono/diheme cytochrome c family protein
MNTRHHALVLGLLAAVVLALWLAACGGGQGPAASNETKVTPALLAQGDTVYKANCIPCHGPLGKGDGPSAAALNPKPRDHTNRQYMDGLTDEQIANTVVHGGAPKYPNMPSHPHIKGQDLVALVAKVRTLSRGVDGVTQVQLAAK